MASSRSRRMPPPTLPYKRPFFQLTLAPHEIEVSGLAAAWWRCGHFGPCSPASALLNASREDTAVACSHACASINSAGQTILEVTTRSDPALGCFLLCRRTWPSSSQIPRGGGDRRHPMATRTCETWIDDTTQLRRLRRQQQERYPTTGLGAILVWQYLVTRMPRRRGEPDLTHKGLDSFVTLL